MVNEAFKSYQDSLLKKEASEQIRVTELVKKHFQDYLKDKRLDTEKWKADLENL